MAEAKKRAAAKKSSAKKAAATKTAAKKSVVKKAPAKKAAAKKGVSGYGGGSVKVVMSVDQVAKEAASIAANAPKVSELDALADGGAFLSINNLRAGYGKMEILHDFSLRIGKGQSLCLIGPNGAGKSTVLHSIFGFTNIFSGSIVIEGEDVTKLTPSQKLAKAGIAYILQDKSVFPQMTVEENLLMGGFLKNKPAEAKIAAEEVFDKYSRLADRRDKPAGVLSGGERRLLEISRALVMRPKVLLVDERRSVSSRGSSIWCSRFSTTSSAGTARPSSWSSRTPRRASPSPISAMSLCRARRRLPAMVTGCSRTPMSDGCSSAADG